MFLTCNHSFAFAYSLILTLICCIHTGMFAPHFFHPSSLATVSSRLEFAQTQFFKKKKKMI